MHLALCFRQFAALVVDYGSDMYFRFCWFDAPRAMLPRLPALASWRSRPCRISSSGCSSGNAKLARPSTGTDALERLSGRRHLVSRSCGYRSSTYQCRRWWTSWLDVLKLFDTAIPEHVIAVPKIPQDSIPHRAVFELQLAEQLVEVPSVVTLRSWQRTFRRSSWTRMGPSPGARWCVLLERHNQLHPVGAPGGIHRQPRGGF